MIRFQCLKNNFLMKRTTSTFSIAIGIGLNEFFIDVTNDASPTETSRYNEGPANAAENAHRAWPVFAMVKPATKSPTLFAHPRKVNPITALLTFQNVPESNSKLKKNFEP